MTTPSSWVYRPQRPRGFTLPRWLRRFGLQQPDVHRNPAFWPYRWVYGRPIVQQITDWATGSQSIADLGCGTGWLTWELARKCPNASILAVDRDAQAVAWAQRNFEDRKRQAEFRTARLEETELPPESFDFVILSFVLGDVKEPRKVLEKAIAALKPGGRIVYYEATAPTPLNLDRLAKWMNRRASLRGQLTDLWNQRRRVESYYAEDPIRQKRFRTEPEADCYAYLQENLEVLHHSRRRALIDMMVDTIPPRRWPFYLPLYVLADRIMVWLGVLEGTCRLALLRKPPKD